MKSSPAIWHYVLSVKSTVKISSIFVAFLENTNFNDYFVISEYVAFYIFLLKFVFSKKATKIEGNLHRRFDT